MFSRRSPLPLLSISHSPTPMEEKPSRRTLGFAGELPTSAAFQRWWPPRAPHVGRLPAGQRTPPPLRQPELAPQLAGRSSPLDSTAGACPSPRRPELGCAPPLAGWLSSSPPRVRKTPLPLPTPASASPPHAAFSLKRGGGAGVSIWLSIGMVFGAY